LPWKILTSTYRIASPYQVNIYHLTFGFLRVAIISILSLLITDPPRSIGNDSSSLLRSSIIEQTTFFFIAIVNREGEQKAGPIQPSGGTSSSGWGLVDGFSVLREGKVPLKKVSRWRGGLLWPMVSVAFEQYILS
jgi:hypothetical protein